MEYVGITAFAFFALITLAVKQTRSLALKRSISEWLVDLASLAIHFFVLPLLQVAFVYELFQWLLPSMKGSISGGILPSLFIYIAVDYAWYWNHRIFHAQTPLWNLHATHHKPDHVDVFITPRNAVLTHFAMVYLWLLGFGFYILEDGHNLAWLIGVGSVVNFWGHTPFNFPAQSLVDRLLSNVIIVPRDHFWHHSRENPRCNFGTVFSLWDRIHGTLYRPGCLPKTFGDETPGTIINQLVWPF